MLLDAAEGASDEARAETMKTLRDMLCSPSATQLVACRGDDASSTDVIATCAVAAREPSGSQAATPLPPGVTPELWAAATGRMLPDDRPSP